MEKRPEDRYNSVAELVEDFTIAAGMEPASVFKFRQPQSCCSTDNTRSS